MPSWASTKVSMATSLPLALKAGPSQRVGQALEKLQRATSFWFATSNTTMAPLRRSTSPSMIFWRHFRAQVDGFVVEMEQQAVRLVEYMHCDRK